LDAVAVCLDNPRGSERACSYSYQAALDIALSGMRCLTASSRQGRAFKGSAQLIEREGGAGMIHDALLKDILLYIERGWHSATLRADHRATLT